MQNRYFAERQEPTALFLYVGCREYYNKYNREYGDISLLKASCWKEYLDARHSGRGPISL